MIWLKEYAGSCAPPATALFVEAGLLTYTIAEGICQWQESLETQKLLIGMTEFQKLSLLHI